MNSTNTYIALLRGINVGGHKKVPMAELRKVMEGMGYRNVRTVIASGNVIFEADAADPKELVSKISDALAEAFGFSIPVLARSFADIEKIIQLEPFAGVTVTPDTRLYVTFLPEPAGNATLPDHVPEGDFRVLGMDHGAVFTVLDLSRTQTVDLMAFLEKKYGKGITTRNWKTLLRIAKV